MLKIKDETWKLIERSIGQVIKGEEFSLDDFIEHVYSLEPEYRERRDAAAAYTGRIAEIDSKLYCWMIEAYPDAKTAKIKDVSYIATNILNVIYPIDYHEEDRMRIINENLLGFLTLYSENGGREYEFYKDVPNITTELFGAKNKAENEEMEIRKQNKQPTSNDDILRTINQKLYNIISEHKNLSGLYRASIEFFNHMGQAQPSEGLHALRFLNYVSALENLFDVSLNGLRKLSGAYSPNISEQIYKSAINFLLAQTANGRKKSGLELLSGIEKEKSALHALDSDYPDMKIIGAAPGRNEIHNFIIAYHLSQSGKFAELGKTILNNLGVDHDSEDSTYIIKDRADDLVLHEYMDFKPCSSFAIYFRDCLVEFCGQQQLDVNKIKGNIIPLLQRRIDDARTARTPTYVDSELFKDFGGSSLSKISEITHTKLCEWLFEDNDDDPQNSFRLILKKPHSMSILTAGNHLHGTVDIEYSQLPTYNPILVQDSRK